MDNGVEMRVFGCEEGESPVFKREFELSRSEEGEGAGTSSVEGFVLGEVQEKLSGWGFFGDLPVGPVFSFLQNLPYEIQILIFLMTCGL